MGGGGKGRTLLYTICYCILVLVLNKTWKKRDASEKNTQVRGDFVDVKGTLILWF